MLITIDVITRQSFSVIYNLDNRQTPSIKINESQIALLIVDSLGNEITEHDRYFNFMVKFWKVEIPSDYSQNTTDYKQTYLPRNIITDLTLRNCSSLNYSKFSPFYETFSKVYFSGVCIDFSNNTDPLFGKFGAVEGYSFLAIYIRKCLNSTNENRTNCFPEDVIDKKLSHVFFNLISIENDVDCNNFTNPISEFYRNEMLPLSSTVFKNYIKDINSVKFRSDNGFLLNNEKTYQSYRTDRIVESVDLRGKNTLFPGTFSQISFRSSGKTEHFDRSYLKATAILSYFGGILQAVILIGQSIVYFYSKNSMVNYLIYHIFDNEEIEDILKNDRRKLVYNKFYCKNFADSNFPFKFNSEYLKQNSKIENIPQEKHNIKSKLNPIRDNKDMKMENLNIIQESNQIYNNFFPIVKENENLSQPKMDESNPYQQCEENKEKNEIQINNYFNNDNSPKIQETIRYKEVPENKVMKEIGDNSLYNINKIGANSNINSSKMNILNKNTSDPNFLDQINNKKRQLIKIF